MNINRKPLHPTRFWRVLVLAPLLTGCGGQQGDSFNAGSSPASSETMADSAGSSAGAPAAAKANAAAPTEGAKAKQATFQLVQAVSQTPRKIVYNATVDLVVEKMDGVESKLLNLVQAQGGFVAEAQTGAQAGAARRGQWKVRVPVDHFPAFMRDVAKLGKLQTTHTNSQDVTAEYYDVAARLDNKQIEERRLLEHLQKSTAKLEDILMIEREISRVRGEIEQLQGQLRVMANLSALSTVTITIAEAKGAVPPSPSASFRTQVGATFAGSLLALRDLARALVLLIVALLPWMVVLAPAGAGFWLWRRRKQRSFPDAGRH